MCGARIQMVPGPTMVQRKTTQSPVNQVVAEGETEKGEIGESQRVTSHQRNASVWTSLANQAPNPCSRVINIHSGPGSDHGEFDWHSTGDTGGHSAQWPPSANN